MNIETLREYCLAKTQVTESFPFGDTTLVFKVFNKMFALVNLDEDLSVNLKCDPVMAIDLREKYSAVIPGYHMNKQHWNTVMIDGTVSDSLLRKWIDHSYELVVMTLPKNKQKNLRQMEVGRLLTTDNSFAIIYRNSKSLKYEKPDSLFF
jgi:predicted DNA-binding protein (MmcQ/YjbR family)